MRRSASHLPVVIHTPGSAVAGAATGGSTAAACADRNALRTALGSRCCGCRRTHLSRRSRVSDRLQNDAPERRASPSIQQRRTAPTRALAVRKHARRLADSATPRTGGLGQSGHVGIISGCTVIAAGWHEFPCEDPPGPGVCATRRSLAASAGRVGSTT